MAATLLQINEFEGINWLMLSRWKLNPESGKVDLHFIDGAPPLVVAAGAPADAVMAYLKNLSDDVSNKKKADDPAPDADEGRSFGDRLNIK